MNLKNKNLARLALVSAAAIGGLTSFLHAEVPSTPRPPAVPLVTCDPYFSVWSEHDKLTDGATSHWTNKPQKLTSLVRIDGKTFRVMGGDPQDVPPLPQTSVTVYPLRTVYEFKQDAVQLTVTFMTPLLPTDLDVCSRPASYITYSAKSTDGNPHEVQVYFDATGELAVDKPNQEVTFGRQTFGNLTALSVGSVEQDILAKRGDDLRIDWGHFYVAVDSTGSSQAIGAPSDTRKAFMDGKKFPGDVDGKVAKAVGAEDAPVLAVVLPTLSAAEEPATAHIIVAYDDEYSIRYMNEDLRPYWRKDGATAGDMIGAADKDYDSLVKKCQAFDDELIADLKKIGGESYAQIGSLAFRQSICAQKICADDNKQPLMFSKENFSNGCISTVDVLYPASPLMMVFSPTLLKASLVPLMDYSSSPKWPYDSAPHDLGTYPQAVGQVYGGSGAPMPVEESGNMLIMLGALAKEEGNADFAVKYWPTVTKWYNYLKKDGLDPASQLCTDDFAGHLARNANLSVKAIMGIASYAQMCEMAGKKEDATVAWDTARDYAKKWCDLGNDGDHFKLAFGEKSNWSQKYNMVWDKLLDWHIFPEGTAQKELAFYRTKMNRYGLPLDSRRDYTKLDWEYWTASMSEGQSDFQAISDACAVWGSETPTRVPLCDWYDTKTGKKSGFQARSVVGGVFIALMRDKEIWSKWYKRDENKPANWAPIPNQPPTMHKLVSAADTEPADWKYTTTKPGGDWMNADFNDGNWQTGKSGFGTDETPASHVGTQWNSDDIWLRRKVTITADKLVDPQLWMHHDEDAQVYINGALAAKAGGFVTDYTVVRLNPAGRKALRVGENVIAVHCHQTAGGQYIDVGIVEVEHRKQ